jgi:phenylalanine-4-hydroxylase
MLRRSLAAFCAPVAAQGYKDAAKSSAVGVKSRPQTSLQVSLPRDEPGALLDALQPFRDNGINIDYIGTRTVPYESTAKRVALFFDCAVHESDKAFQAALAEVKAKQPFVDVLGSWDVPWYPTRKSHLDLLKQETLEGGADLMTDDENPHPGFNDKEYRARREKIVQNGLDFTYSSGKPIPNCDYSEAEHATWTAVWDKLIALYPTHACEAYNQALPLLMESGIFTREKIPQLQDVSDLMMDQTGWQIRPVAGLLSGRDFLSGLAHRTFFSTQYIRHPSQPFYTPEPDVVHELMGHVPMLLDPGFADFSQAYGMLSLGADDATIEKLASCYWFTVEFGVVAEKGGVRAYGAGLLSSFGELEYCVSDKPELLPWNPKVAATTTYPITKFQPTYFVAADFLDAQQKLKDFAKTMNPPFDVTYNKNSRRIKTYARHFGKAQ